MANNTLIPFTKAWNAKDGNYGEKKCFFNTELPVRSIESCRLKKDGKEIECTKIIYDINTFVTLLGTPEEFFAKCRDANTTVFMLQELDRNDLTIKQFLEGMERVNGNILI